jgi:hypothetical protein
VGFSSSRLLGTGLELLLAGRESVSGRARSESCGLRMARRVSWRDTWSAAIVDMLCMNEVQDGTVDDGCGKSSSSEPRQKLPSGLRPDQYHLRAPTASIQQYIMLHIKTLQLFDMLEITCRTSIFSNPAKGFHSFLSSLSLYIQPEQPF